jgi:hypothetical protein
MTFPLARTLAFVSSLCLMLCALLHAQCPVNSIAIKGHVENPPRNASVRVLLLYPPDPYKKRSGTEPDQPGESAEAILDGDTFTIPIEFLTNDRRTVMNFKPACERKPQAVVVTLKQGGTSDASDQELDRVSLNFPHDFKSDDSQHYTLRSELVLKRGEP